MNKHALLSGTNLSKRFKPTSRNTPDILTALDGVTLELFPGETLGIAGESGCGKSTLAKIIAGLLVPDQGIVSFRGVSLPSLSGRERKAFRRSVQMIFQDPFSSLNPRMRVGDTIAEPLLIAGVSRVERQEQTVRICRTVGLDCDSLNRFPDEFSGGQRQRIGIARALISAPEIIVADEPVSSLDISIQAQIINLLLQMKQTMNLSMMIISHNLLVLRHICDRIIVMYLGIIVEFASVSQLFTQCRHPYTEALIAAIPSIFPGSHGKKQILAGDLPSPYAIPQGCRFHPRCRYAQDICRHEIPALREITEHHSAACHFSESLYL